MKFFGKFIISFAVIFLSACNQVDFTAPAASKLTLTITPTTVPANGLATLTVVGTRANGAPLPDGTVVRFETTNLGTISPNPVDTKDGVAIARFRASTRSGTATITAVSGDISSASVDIEVGEARARTVLLTATPQTLPQGGGTTELRAFVRDDAGNPISGVQVFFTADNGTLQSNGRAIRTDSGGVARDRLTTNLDTIVTAQTSNGKTSNQVTVVVGPGPGPGSIVCGFEISPTDLVTIGETVFFTDTSTAGNDAHITGSRWDFGDGNTASGRSVEHKYRDTGTFTVVHTVTDNFGNTATCAKSVTVTRGEPVCTFTFSPTSPFDGQIVTFDASGSSDPDGIIVDFAWNFGDGTQTHTSSPVTQHTYTCPSTTDVDITVSLTVTDDSGNTDSCTQSFVLNCGP